MGEGLAKGPQPDHSDEQADDSASPQARFRRAVEAIIEWARRREHDASGIRR